MSDTASQRVEQSDAELITAVRAGNTVAYGALFDRHRSAALRLSRQLLPGAESEDLVSEAFVKVLIQLKRGHGPDLAFRAYLLTTVRRLHVDRVRSAAHVRTTDDESLLDQHVEFFDVAAANFERGTAANAFASLPERWQLVLWHLDVEGQKPADVAPLLGMSANSVSALAYRAREGLRQAYLQQHLTDTASGDCRWTTERLGAHVRKGLSNRDAGRVDGHLDDCRRCMGIYLELIEVNSDLSGILAPAVLGAAAAGYLTGGTVAAGSAAAATAAGAEGSKGLVSAGPKAALESAKAAVTGMGAPGAAAVAVVAALAATGIYAGTGGFTRHDDASASSTIGTDPELPPTVLPTEPTPAPAVPGPAATVGPAVRQPGSFSSPPGAVYALPPALSNGQQGFPVAEPPRVPPSGPPSAPVVVPTDFAFAGAVTATNQGALFQRRITVPVGSTTDGRRRENLNLSIRIDFDEETLFGGVVGVGWKCGGSPNTPALTVNCTRTQSGASVPDLVFEATGRAPAGTVGATLTLAAAGNTDPNPRNNSSRYASGPWPVSPTDFGIGPITSADDGLSQRTVTIPVDSETDGLAKEALVLTTTVVLDTPLQLGDIAGKDWDCGRPTESKLVSELTCTRTQTGPKVPALVFSAIGIKEFSLPLSGTATVSAAGNADPKKENDRVRFEVGGRIPNS